MALNPIQVLDEPGKRGKGGLIGKIAGGVIGAVGGAFVGGPGGAVTGAGLGSSIGGTIGGMAAPGKEGKAGNALQTTASQDSEVKLAQLMDAQKELLNSLKIAAPDKDRANLEVFTPAIEALRKQRGM